MIPFTCPPFSRLVVDLRAATPLDLPGWLGSTLHGLIGHALHRHDGATGNELANRWLQPQHRALPGWLGVAQVPPLVVRPPAVAAERRHLGAGASIRFELIVLGAGPGELVALAEALATQLPQLPFGSRDQRVEVEGLAPVTGPNPHFDPALLAATRTLHFGAHTPLVLRRNGDLLDRPGPVDLALAAVRRLASIQAAYGTSVPAVHLGGLAQQLGADLTVDRARWTPFRQRRYSARQRRRHPVRGTLGAAVLRGPVAPLAQLLTHAAPFGLGKGAALGLGAFDVALGHD